MSDRVEGLSPAKRRLLEALQAKRSSKVDKVAGELVRLRDGGSDKPPVVLIHPIGGGVFCYADLGRLIPGDRAVWAIAAGELLAKGAPPTVTQIALAYLDLLRANGVSGAAVLAGWSFGGLVAREMARQCATRPVLVLIDTAPWPSDVPAWSSAETLEVFVEDLLRSAGVTFDRVPVDSDLWNLPTEQALSAVGACLSEQGLDLKLTPSERMTRVRIFENATRAMQRHRPGEYGGPTTVLHALESDVSPHYWAERAEGRPPTTIALAGDHFSLLRPPTVAQVAQAINRAAEAAPVNHTLRSVDE
ncbi:thioesterase domain-containing protein [Micromonospora ureilytica]|uniref:Thioesterase domain-containing protein n=1 Tax=Micromonospora ureilytica TaxID=709868 RepID=A0ABS0JRH1_9ACTN|nr:alpha/beta fold hydrolase [Micromonospora ureilytica]MBG6069648.1 thioesterase domain-containing protein [Micromonospora ureilytica]